ncbi:MAG: hypothetical protein PHV30_05545 [Candidatus Margulisbacteria bacterium]|nr:hypothetical protein [Candidatus Margulisiibacteriota bacterium]
MFRKSITESNILMLLAVSAAALIILWGCGGDTPTKKSFDYNDLKYRLQLTEEQSAKFEPIINRYEEQTEQLIITADKKTPEEKYQFMVDNFNLMKESLLAECTPILSEGQLNKFKLMLDGTITRILPRKVQKVKMNNKSSYREMNEGMEDSDMY